MLRFAPSSRVIKLRVRRQIRPEMSKLYPHFQLRFVGSYSDFGISDESDARAVDSDPIYVCRIHGRRVVNDEPSRLMDATSDMELRFRSKTRLIANQSFQKALAYGCINIHANFLPRFD
jgi:hypothetical protein